MSVWDQERRINPTARAVTPRAEPFPPAEHLAEQLYRYQALWALPKALAVRERRTPRSVRTPQMPRGPATAPHTPICTHSNVSTSWMCSLLNSSRQGKVEQPQLPCCFRKKPHTAPPSSHSEQYCLLTNRLWHRSVSTTLITQAMEKVSGLLVHSFSTSIKVSLAQR